MHRFEYFASGQDRVSQFQADKFSEEEGVDTKVLDILKMTSGTHVRVVRNLNMTLQLCFNIILLVSILHLNLQLQLFSIMVNLLTFQYF